ncbi:MAG: hypothetical protein KC503_33925 [Myxococcales bacterium]|nr:hypothetical protein [Myxococcales bacterium]
MMHRWILIVALCAPAVTHAQKPSGTPKIVTLKVTVAGLSPKRASIDVGQTLELVNDVDRSVDISLAPKNRPRKDVRLKRKGRRRIVIDPSFAGVQIDITATYRQGNRKKTLTSAVVVGKANKPPASQPALNNTPTTLPAAKDATDLAYCTDAQLRPTTDEASKLDKTCNSNDGEHAHLCLSPSGRLITHPKAKWKALRQGQSVTISLYTRTLEAAFYTLDVKTERHRLLRSGEKAAFKASKNDNPWIVSATFHLRLVNVSALIIKVVAEPHPESIFATGQTKCRVREQQRTKTFSIPGTSFFSVGVLMSYTHLAERSFGLAVGDDGVSRITRDQGPNVDVVLSMLAYPFGIRDDRSSLCPVVGLLLGTSLRDPALRWYLGGVLQWPLGLGVAVGVALNVLPKLGQDLREGQPLSGPVVTHDRAEVTWFVGAVVDLALFKKIFNVVAPKLGIE